MTPYNYNEGFNVKKVVASVAVLLLIVYGVFNARKLIEGPQIEVFEPTYGSLSRHGVIAMGNSLDQVSPIGKTVADVEIVFNALSKHDKNDATSIKEENRIPEKNIQSKKIGIPWHLFEDGLNSEIMHNFKESVSKLEKEGYEIVDIQLPFSKYSLAVYYIIMPAEVSTNLSRFDGVRYGLRVEGNSVSDMFKKSRSKGLVEAVPEDDHAISLEALEPDSVTLERQGDLGFVLRVDFQPCSLADRSHEPADFLQIM
jgi:hypothetical protein